VRQGFILFILQKLQKPGKKLTYDKIREYQEAKEPLEKNTANVKAAEVFGDAELASEKRRKSSGAWFLLRAFLYTG
jgi:hypothetical protein